MSLPCGSSLKRVWEFEPARRFLGSGLPGQVFQHKTRLSSLCRPTRRAIPRQRHGGTDAEGVAMRPQPLSAGPVPSSPGDLLVVPVVEQVCRRGKQQELDGGCGLSHRGRGPYQVTGTLRFSPLKRGGSSTLPTRPSGPPPETPRSIGTVATTPGVSRCSLHVFTRIARRAESSCRCSTPNNVPSLSSRALPPDNHQPTIPDRPPVFKPHGPRGTLREECVGTNGAHAHHPSVATRSPGRVSVPSELGRGRGGHHVRTTQSRVV